MFKAIIHPFSFSVSDAVSRAMCYLLGPFSGTLLLHVGHHSADLAVRFHAFHSMLMAAVWAAGWGALRLAEAIAPWFLGTVVKELRLAMNLTFVLAWICLVAAAYQGRRCAVLPWVHALATRLAWRGEARRGA